MKVKLDENMPEAMLELLREDKHDVMTAVQEMLQGAKDEDVLVIATREDRLLMTFDVDFADIRKYPPGSHAGVVVFRLRDQRWQSLEPPARGLLRSGTLNRLHGGLAVVTETRVRLRTGRNRHT